MGWHKSEYQNSILSFYFRVAICSIGLFSLGCSGLQQQHQLPQPPLSCLLPLFLYSFYFSSMLYFGFYFQEKMRRGLQVSSDNPGLYNEDSSLSVLHSFMWFGHIIEQSLTLSPGEIRESTARQDTAHFFTARLEGCLIFAFKRARTVCFLLPRISQVNSS